MGNKYIIVYPPGHGGNFLGELLTLGEDCYSCDANMLENTQADRLAAYVARYTEPGDWIDNEALRRSFRKKHIEKSAKIDVIQAHLYRVELTKDVGIIVADAFGSHAGVAWADASRYHLFLPKYGVHHDEDKNYNILKNSKLPMLCVDMTRFLDPMFPESYYEFLCQQLGIQPVTLSAIQLHGVWYEQRVKKLQPCPMITDWLRQAWSICQQQDIHNEHLLQCQNNITNRKQVQAEVYQQVRGPDWPDYATSEDFFDHLPDWVKQECVDFGIVWNDLGVVETHDHTQLAITHGYPVDPYYQHSYILPNLLLIEQQKI